MKKEEIHLGDIHRILFGQAPPEFLLEVLIRTVMVYVAAIVVMNWTKMKQTQITVERLLAQARHSGIRQLGEIRRLYFE